MDEYNQLRRAFNAFVKEREWEQFHSPKNTAICLAVEAGELLELYTWVDNARPDSPPGTQEPPQHRVDDEVADVLLSLLSFCKAAQVDPIAAARAKLGRLEKKYPLDLAKGSAIKDPTNSP